MSDRARKCANAIVRRARAMAEGHATGAVAWEQLRVEIFHAISNTEQRTAPSAGSPVGQCK